MGLFRARGVILSVLVKLCRGTLARSQRYSQVRGIHEMPGAVRPITGLPALTLPTSASQSAAFSASLFARPTQRRVERPVSANTQRNAAATSSLHSPHPRPPPPPLPHPSPLFNEDSTPKWREPQTKTYLPPVSYTHLTLPTSVYV